MGYILCQYLDDFIQRIFNLGHIFCCKWGLVSSPLHSLRYFLILKKWGLSPERFLDTEHDPCALECAVLRCFVIRSLLQNITRITYLLLFYSSTFSYFTNNLKGWWQRVMCNLIWDSATYFITIAVNKPFKKQSLAKQFCVMNCLYYIFGSMLYTDTQCKYLNLDLF